MSLHQYCTVVINVTFKKYEFSNIVLFQDCFGYLKFHTNLKMGFSISAENIIGILIETALNLQIAMGNILS